MSTAVDMSGTAPEKSDLFRLLVASVKDYAIFLLDAGGYIQSWNDGARNIKQYTADEIIGKHFSIFYPASEQLAGKPELAITVATRDGRWEGEGWRVRKDGSLFWANVVITALFGPDGALVGFAKVTRDLTERKRADEERQTLLELEHTARVDAEGALDRLRAVYSVTETALSHLAVDDLLHALLERICEILTVDTVAVLLLAEDEPDLLIARAVRGVNKAVLPGARFPRHMGVAGRLATASGPLMLSDVAASGIVDPLLDDTGVLAVLAVPMVIEGSVLGVLHVGSVRRRAWTAADLQFLQLVADRVAQATDRARLSDSARQAQVKADVAEAMLRAQDEFLSIAAHELKTPVTSLKLATQFLQRRFHQPAAPDPEQVRRTLQTIDLQSDKLSRLVIQLLETARLQVAHITLSLSWTNITALVRFLIDQAELRTEQPHMILAEGETVWASVDALRLEQVITNLLDNAIKFSPLGAAVELEVCDWQADTIRLIVRDHGIGVPPQHRDHLFDRFYQAHAASHRSGLGLGLYISREIVTLHGGTITAEFPPDGGTRFIITLPRGSREPAPPVETEDT